MATTMGKYGNAQMRADMLRELSEEEREELFGELNEPQKVTIERLSKILPIAHYTNIVVRIDGQDEVYEADWLKSIFRRRVSDPENPLRKENG